ncbi:hypothetical protein BDC45DRAFT_531333 [Circinella umbellata]|nr:hypothetical protein BDC45DRAFT_531333 [Circinella umbellata]
MGLLCYTLVTVAGGAIAATGVGVPLIGLMGFSAAGPVAGTVAAGAQAYVGNVVAGSIFAGLQTLAMAPCILNRILSFFMRQLNKTWLSNTAYYKTNPVHKVIELKGDEDYHAIRIKRKTIRCLRRNRIIDPTLYLLAFPRDRHRLQPRNREHYKNCSLLQPLLEDLNSAFGNLPILHTELRPLEFINRLPRSELDISLGRWKKAWPALINVLREIDRLSYPKDDFC